MGRIIRSSRPCPGGRLVSIEITEAYTDGRSRLEEVFIADAAVRGKTPAEKLQALFEAIGDPIAEVSGEDVAEPAVSKDIVESRMVPLYETWQRWKATRLEAEARGMPAAVQQALTTRENLAWAAYVAAIVAWRGL